MPDIDEGLENLSAEAVQSASLAFQGIDDIHGGDSLALGVLTVGDGITDDVLQEDLQDTASLLVDETADALDTTTTSETADSWLGDSLDVITQDLKSTEFNTRQSKLEVDSPCDGAWRLLFPILFLPFHGQTLLFVERVS